MMKTVVALYFDIRKASSTREELIATGFYRDGGMAFRSSRSEEMPDVTVGADVVQHLVRAGVPRERAAAYAEGVRRGGTLVMVNVEDGELDLVERMLDRHHPIDLDRALLRWRNAGWSGYDASAPPFTDRQISRERELIARDALALVEEEIEGGMSDGVGGGVRARTCVVETPVQEQGTEHLCEAACGTHSIAANAVLSEVPRWGRSRCSS